jgi:phosphoribosylglycinamide formyltransferase 1
MPVSVAVLVSGGGTNLQELLDALRGSEVARVARVVSSRPDAGALVRARRAGVPTVVLRDPADADELLAALSDAGLVVLAGYVKRVPPAVVARFRLRMINIHPALLPAFGGPGMYGLRVHERVLASGAPISGVTVHYVDEEYDHGPIIAQWPVPVRPGDAPETLAARVLEAEHRLLPLVVLQLARRGERGGRGGSVPEAPVRLFAHGAAFVAHDEPSVELENATDGRTVGRSDG